jgi:uncharacterized repeat protein (TIGR01451 family)
LILLNKNRASATSATCELPPWLMTRLLAVIWCGVVLLALALYARPASAESFYGIDNTAIYSVDTLAGGPVTTLFTFAPALNSGVTLAVRPSDGVLFFLDTQNANPTMRSWDPATPTVSPVVVGTLGVGVSGVIRLAFDATGKLFASNGGATGVLWEIDPASGAILSATTLSGAVTLAGSGDICLQPGTGTLFTVGGTSLFTLNQSTAVNTLIGTMALPGNATGCAFDSAGRLVVSSIGANQLYLVNPVTAAVSLLPQTTGTINFLDLATGPARTADLRLTKTATNITPANAVSFTITVTNDGPDRATDVRVLDALPAGLTFVSATASQGTYSAVAVTPNPAGTWQVGALNNGASATLTINATVAGATSTAINTAQVYYADQRDPDSTPNNNNAAEDDQGSVTINRSADLQVVKSTATSFAVGLNGVYTLTVNNLPGSASTAGNYAVTDLMPTGLTLVGATGTGWNCTASTSTQMSCTSSAVIAAGASNPNAITLTVAVGAGAVPSVSNTATVSGGGELNLTNFTSNNSSTVVTPVCSTACPDLRPNKSLTAPSAVSLTVGTNSTYTLSVTNIGGLPTSGAYTITDPMPTGLSIVVAPTGTNWNCTASTASLVSCTSSTVLAAGASSANITFQVSVANTAVPSVTNIATVSDGGDPNAGNNTATLVTPVIDFDLTVTKTTASTFTLGGANPTYTITVNNIGGRATTNTSDITVTDTLPTGLTFVSGSGTGWNACTAVLQVVTCVRPAANTIAAGASAPAITLTVSINAAVGSTVTNTATVTKPDEAAVLAGNNSTVVSPVNAPDLRVTKTHTGNFTVGTNAVYTITVFNIGTQVTNALVTVTDTLPTGMTFVSGSGTGWNACTAVLQVVTCTRNAGNTIAAGSAAPAITLTVTPTVAGTVTNNVSVSGGGEPTGNNGNNTDADITDVFITPTVTKGFAPASVVAGVTSVLTVTINNPAAIVLTGVAVIDPFPPGMSVTAAPGFNNTCGGTIVSGNTQGDTVISLTGGTLAANSSCVIQVNVSSTTIGANLNTVGQVSTTNNGTSNTSVASRQATLTVTAPPAPVLSKLSNPNPVGVNQLSTLTFTIVKSGAVTNNNMAFIDTFPAGVVYQGTVSTAANCGGGVVFQDHLSGVLAAGDVGIRISNIDMGTNTLCTIVINVSSAAPGTYVNNNARISGLLNGLTADVNDTLVVVGTTLTKAFSLSTVVIDQSSNLTFTITNGTGAPPQSGLAFTETLPANVVVASAPTPSQCSGTVTATVGTNTITFSGGAMASGLASCAIVIPVKSSVGGTYNNTPANVTGVSAGMTNNATATLTVNTGVALSVTKSIKTICDPQNFAGNGTTIFPKAIPGAYMQYTIKIDNAAGAVNSATLTSIIDALDPYLNFDVDLRTGSASACAASPPESAAGKGFAMTCAGGTRACNTTVYFTSNAGDDAMGLAGSSITLTFGDTPGAPKALPTEAGYGAGELKPGESVTIRFNTIVK